MSLEINKHNLSRIVASLVIVISLLTANLMAQDDELGPTLILNGIAEVDREDLEGVSVTVLDDGNLVQSETTDKRGRFEVEMPMGSVFTIEFSKQDYATKRIEVDTRNVDEEMAKWGFEWPKMKVEMYPILEGVDYSVLKEPIGKIGYNDLIGNFDVDKKYQRSMNENIDRLERQLKLAKREEEQRQEQLEEDYKLAIQDGELFLEEKDYQNALFQFQAAAELKPESLLPKNKIEEINKILDAERSEEDKYIALLSRADNAFASEVWEESKDFYTRALNIFPDKSYPKEQIEIIDAKLAEIAERMRQEELARKKQAELQASFDEAMENGEKAFSKENYLEAKTFFEEAKQYLPENPQPDLRIAKIDELLGNLEARYTSLIAQADSAFSSQNFEMAISRYEDALELKPQEQYPETQIKKSKEQQDLLADKNKAYQKLMEDGADALEKEEFKNALAFYQQASELKPGEALPKDKIKTIEGILAARAAELAQKQKAEKERLAQLKAEFDQLVQKADAAFEQKEFQEAKTLYQEAKTKEQDNTYVDAQLIKVENQLALIASKEEAYAAAISKGDKLFDLQSWQEAKTAYSEALTAKPNDEYATQKLSAVNTKLDELARLEEEKRQQEIAAQKALDEKYNALIASADAAFDEEQWETAKADYTAAAELKSEETFPRQQLELVNSKIAEAKRLAEEAKRAAELAAKNAEQYDALLSQGNSFLNLQNYQAAKSKYEEAKALIPSREEATNKLAEVNDLIAKKQAEEEAKRQAELAQKQKNEAYADAMMRGNTALEAQQFETALAAFEEAATIKPEEALPQEKILETKDAQAKLIAQEEAARKAREEQERKLKEYNEYIASADKAFKNEDYQDAAEDYKAAAAVFPEEKYPQNQLIKINNILERKKRIAEENAKNDTEFNLELARKYDQGLTEKEFKEGNKTVTQIIYVDGNRGDEYRKEKYSWGQTFYLKNGKPYNEVNWTKEVEALR